MPGKRYSQHYHFSVVIHNVKDETLKPKLVPLVDELQPDWSLIAQEAYNEDYKPGSHIHVFLKYNKKKSWKTVLDFFNKHSRGLIMSGKFLIPCGKHQGKEATLGHIKVKTGKGDFNECRKYLTAPDKIKKLDNNISENVRKLSPAEKYPELTTLCLDCGSKSYDPFISLGDSSFQSHLCLKCANRRLAKLSKGPPLPLGPPPQ